MSLIRSDTKKLRGTFHSSVPEGQRSLYTKQAKAHALRERLGLFLVYLENSLFSGTRLSLTQLCYVDMLSAFYLSIFNYILRY